MSVQFRSVGSLVKAQYSGSTGNFVLSPPPSLAQNDLWMASIVVDSDTAVGDITTPSGWIKHFDDRNNGDQWPRGFIFYKFAGASESDTTFACGTGSYGVHGISSSFIGVNQTTPISTVVPTEYYGNTTGTNNWDPSTITVANDGSMVCLFMFFQIYGGGVAYVNSPADFTQLFLQDEGTAPNNYDKGYLGYVARNAGDFSPNNITVSSGAGPTRLNTALFTLLPAAEEQINPVKGYRTQTEFLPGEGPYNPAQFMTRRGHRPTLIQQPAGSLRRIFHIY